MTTVLCDLLDCSTFSCDGRSLVPVRGDILRIGHRTLHWTNFKTGTVRQDSTFIAMKCKFGSCIEALKLRY